VIGILRRAGNLIKERPVLGFFLSFTATLMAMIPPRSRHCNSRKRQPLSLMSTVFVAVQPIFFANPHICIALVHA
jgi:hypothetical protein